MANFRQFVIPDIHGCYYTLKELLQKVNFTKNDRLYLLGDYIDRGKYPDKVLDLLIKFKKLNYNIFPLRGNHEQNILDAQKEFNKQTFTLFVGKMNKSPYLLKKNGKLKKRYKKFFKSLPYFIELDDFYLVHAGFNFKKENIFEDYESMLVTSSKYVEPEKLKGKRVIHGHKVHTLKEIKEAIKSGAPLIPLDNGCVYTKAHKVYDYKKSGNLCCLNLDSMELTVQENIDNP